jgi:hypothetical protein
MPGSPLPPPSGANPKTEATHPLHCPATAPYPSPSSPRQPLTSRGVWFQIPHYYLSVDLEMDGLLESAQAFEAQGNTVPSPLSPTT